MQRTKLGISVALAAAALYFLGLFGGYIIIGIAVGYVLLREEDQQLRKDAVRVLLLMFAFSLMSAALSLVPSLLSIISSTLEIFGGVSYFTFFHRVHNVLNSILGLLETVVFLRLGLAALLRKHVKLPVIDPIIKKYMA